MTAMRAPIMSIAAVADMLNRCVAELSPDELPALIGELAAAKVRAETRLSVLAASQIPAGDTTLVAQQEWLTFKKLVERTDYGASTIRSWVASGFLRRGQHYTGDGKNRRFFLQPIKARLDEATVDAPTKEKVQVRPFFRTGRRTNGQSTAA